MKVCVTGGAGFIGTHLVARLARDGHRVVVIDNLSTGAADNLARMMLGNPTGIMADSGGSAATSAIELVAADIRDDQTLAAALSGCDVILHQAALGSVPRSIADPMASHNANATGTLAIILAARRAGVRRVVLASSSSVYGANPVLPRQEDLRLDPVSPYAASKVAAEAYARACAAVYGMETVMLRYFNVFGPWQNPDSQYAAVIPRFITRMLDGLRPIIHGDGRQSRDFTYVDNVVAANLLAMEAPPGAGGVYNVACGQQHTLLDLVAAINAALGTELAPEFGPLRTGDTMHSRADITRARQVLGYAPQVDFAEGIRRTVAWYRNEREMHPVS